MSDPNADLLRRVQRLEAIHEIERLKYRYWRACDHKDQDAFRECFIKHGADIDYGVVGKFNDSEPLVEVFTQVLLANEGESWLVHDVHHGRSDERRVGREVVRPCSSRRSPIQSKKNTNHPP